MSAPVDTEKRRPTGWRERARISTEKATSQPDMENLSSTLKRGAAYSAAALLFGQLISFVQTLVLANLLQPRDVGIYVAGALLSGFLISVSEGGLRGALVQREDNVATAADTVFWATGGTGMLLAVVALGTAPLVGFASGFDAADAATVAAIAAVNSGTMIIHALTNVPDGLMQRQFNFRRRLIVDPARMAMFAVVSITFAAMGYGPWAQVIGNYAAMLTWLALSWWFSGWWPGFTKPSYRMWREMAKFAYPLMLEGLVDKVRTAVETTLIARGLSSDPLGQYRYGQRLSLIPGNAVVQIGSYVLFPAFSRLASDPGRLRNAFLRGLQWAWIASVAVAGLVVAIGEPAVVVLFGPQWRGAGIAFVALAGFGPGIALQAAGSEAIKATGRSQLLNWTTAVSIGLGLGLLVLLIPSLGLVGVGLAVSITEMVVGAVILVLTYRVIPFAVPAMLRTLLPPLLVAAVAGAATWYVDRQFVGSGEINRLLGVLALVGESLLFMVIFLAGMALVEPKLARRAVRAIKSKLRRGADDDDEDDGEGADDGIERPDPRFDPPTMLIPVFAADETGEFGRRQMRDWGSPTAQTMVMPVVRPRAPARPVEVEETTKIPAHLAAADAAVDRAEDAIEAGERIDVGSPLSPFDGPTQMALPARPAESGEPRRPAGGDPAEPGPRTTGESGAHRRGGPASPANGMPAHDPRNSGGFPRPQGAPVGPGRQGPVQGAGRPARGRPGPAPYGPGPNGAGRPGQHPAGPRPPAPGPNGGGPNRPGPNGGGPNGGGPARPGPNGSARPGPNGAGPNGAGPNGAGPNGAGPGTGPNGAVPVGAMPRGPVPAGRQGPGPRHGSDGAPRHARQAPPNGGRGPRPPTPPRGMEGQPLPRPLQGPLPATIGPAAHPVPSPQPGHPAAAGPSPSRPSPTPRRHRYLDSGPQPVVDETVLDPEPPRRHRYRDDESGEAVLPADRTRENPHTRDR